MPRIIHVISFHAKRELPGIAKDGDEVRITLANEQFPYVIKEATVAAHPLGVHQRDALGMLIADRLAHFGCKTSCYKLNNIASSFGLEVKFYDVVESPVAVILNMYIALVTTYDEDSWRLTKSE